MYVWLWVEFWLSQKRSILRFCMCVECMCLCVCIYREGGMSVWVRVFTPWPQTGVLKPLWQCAQTTFSLPSSPSISLCQSLHPRGHVLRHLHPGSVCVIFSPPTPTPDACFLHPFLCSFFSQHALDTLYTPTLSTTPCFPLLPPPLLSIPPSLLGSGVSNQCLSCLIPSRCCAAVCVCVYVSASACVFVSAWLWCPCI